MMKLIHGSGWILHLILFMYLLTSHSLGLASNVLDQGSDYQRGKQAFSIYCQGCHTLRYADHATLNTPIDEIQRWFGKTPPDLSNIARGRSTIWLTRFLSDFYPDAERPFGSNNRQFKNVAMPNVLASITDEKERAQTIHDIVIYLDEIADPNQSLRKKTGFKILAFFFCFITCFWLIQRINQTNFAKIDKM